MIILGGLFSGWIQKRPMRLLNKGRNYNRNTDMHCARDTMALFKYTHT